MRKRGELVKLDRNEEPVDDGFSRTKSVDVSYDLIMTLSGEWQRNCDSGGLTARPWLIWDQGVPPAGGQRLWLPTGQVGWWDIIKLSQPNPPESPCS